MLLLKATLALFDIGRQQWCQAKTIVKFLSHVAGSDNTFKAVALATGSKIRNTRSSLKFTPSLHMRPISTHINILVTGPSGAGKTSFIKAFAEALDAPPVPCALGTTSLAPTVCSDADDPLTAFQLDPSAWTTKLSPVQVPQASRELVYTLTVSEP